MVTESTCGFCRRPFMPDEAQPTCAACPLRGSCLLVRCPHCGYENPVSPPWLARLQGWFHRSAVNTDATTQETGPW